jgi:hypothetical protein
LHLNVLQQKSGSQNRDPDFVFPANDKERSARLINPEYPYQDHLAQALEILETCPYFAILSTFAIL